MHPFSPHNDTFKFFFIPRTIIAWNALPSVGLVVDCKPTSQTSLVTGRLGPYASSNPIPTRTLDQLGHYQLGHHDKPIQTLYQLGPHDYITHSDTTQTLLIGLLVEHSRSDSMILYNQLGHYTCTLLIGGVKRQRDLLNAITECNANWEFSARNQHSLGIEVTPVNHPLVVKQWECKYISATSM